MSRWGGERRPGEGGTTVTYASFTGSVRCSQELRGILGTASQKT